MGKKKKDDTFPFTPILMVISSYVLGLIYTVIQGAFNVPIWSFGVLLIVLFLIFYFSAHDRLKGLPLLLSLSFFTVWIYPTGCYLLFKNNPANYHLSEEFIRNEKALIDEMVKNKIPIKDLKRIREYLGDSSVMVFPKLIHIPEKYNFEYRIVNSQGKEKLTIVKNDSIKTDLIYYRTSPFKDGEKSMTLPRNITIIDAINREIDDLEKLQGFNETNRTNIPYSEFWTESIISFSSGDIKPVRNLPKILNILQILATFFLSNILLNTVNNNLRVKKKKRKKG